MDPCIAASGDSLLHLHSQIMRTTLPPPVYPRLVVDFHVCVPAATNRHDSHTFSFCSLPTAVPYRHWRRVVAQMIHIAAGHHALALDLGHLVLDFCTYTHAALFSFPASPGHVLFVSAVIEVATDLSPRHFYYFPFPGAALHVDHDVVNHFHYFSLPGAPLHVVQEVVNPVTPAGYRFDGGTPASASPIRRRKSVKIVVVGEAAAEGDRESSCAICLEEYETGDVLHELLCGHRFHPRCIVEWFRKRPTCPLCRMPVLLDEQ